MEKLFEEEKVILRTRKGRFASELQYLRSENQKLKDELELEKRKRPTWQMIRDFYKQKEIDRLSNLF